MTKSTIIIVTHDIKLASQAKEIIVLDEGKISSVGSHNKLMKTSQWYSKAYKKVLNEE
jgi:ABC-type multidrug transport system fused ATPase/permease subunit